MEEDIIITDEDADAINRSEEQIDRGESVELEAFAAAVRRQFGEV